MTNGRIGPVVEERDRFVIEALLEQGEDALRVAVYTIRKESWDAWWERVRDKFDPLGVELVAAEGRMLPQPGDDAAGSQGCATDDTWDNGMMDDLPDPRYNHSAVWTGSEMIIWGGRGGGPRLASGGRYDPATDSWTPVSTVDAPPAREQHTAIWTGTEMIVWGGAGVDDPYLDTGGRYDPDADTWTPTNTANVPAARRFHTAVWTGDEMIVWGGSSGGTNYVNTGGRYDPFTNTWAAISSLGTPSARRNHAAIWDGSRMIVWGGIGTGSALGDGTRYDPGADTWLPITTAGEPLGRGGHTAVWTGNELIVWGGYDPTIPEEPPVYDTGGRYDPAADAWTPTPTLEAPLARRGHTALWTGTRMVVWGGANNPPIETFLDTGGQYDPVADTWTATSTTSAPNGRRDHGGVWTGSEMIVWGGTNGAYLNNGGRYVTCRPSNDPPTFVKQWGAPGNGPGQLSGPHGIVVAPNGDLYVAATGNHRVQKFSATGAFLLKWGSFGGGDGQFQHNHGLGVDRQTGHVYVADRNQDRVQEFTNDGEFVRAWGSSGTGDGQFTGTNGVAVDSEGYVYVGDSSPRIQKFTRDGTFLLS